MLAFQRCNGCGRHGAQQIVALQHTLQFSDERAFRHIPVGFLGGILGWDFPRLANVSQHYPQSLCIVLIEHTLTRRPSFCGARN
jgi:hypothetical protein